MSTTFDARCIIVSDEEAFLLIGLADQEDGTQAYVTLQREHEPGEQEIALGLDGVYIERDDQVQAIYDGVEAIRLTPSLVCFTLSPTGAHALGTETELHVGITPTDNELEMLRDGLRRMCAGKVTLQIDPAIEQRLGS